MKNIWKTLNKNSKKKICHITTLLLLVLIVFGNVFANDFVWDDSLYLLNIEAYRNLDLKRFFLGLGNGVEYLPVKDLSYAIDFILWGVNPAGFHATNLILYFLNVVAVYLLAETVASTIAQYAITYGKLSGEDIPFWTAAIFALHPIHCETVNFIGGGRNTLLAGLFCFLAARSFILFIRDTFGFNSRRLAASFFWYVLAVLSKATAVSLPIFFLALFVVVKKRSLVKDLISILPFFALTGIIYAVFTSIATKYGVINPFVNLHVPLLYRIATAVQIPFFYLGKLIFPYRLSVDYMVVFGSWMASPYAFIAAITFVVLALCTFFLRSKLPDLFVSFCWFTVTLLPVMQLLPSAMNVADRYAYIPSFAFCYLLASMACRLNIWGPHVLAVVGGALLCVYGFLSFEQNKVWKTNFDLWEYTISVSPNSLQALTNLGANYYFIGNYQKSFDYFDRVRKVNPLDPAYDFFKGHYFYLRGNVPDAVRSFEQALAKKSDLIDALYHMGIICEDAGNLDGAASYYRRILSSQDLDRSDFKKIAAERLESFKIAGFLNR